MTRRIFIGFFMAFLIILIMISIHVMNFIKLRHATENNNILNVATIQAIIGPATEKIILPGNVQAWHETAIYARTNGYVVEWLTDIGAQVKAGDVLAIISTPEMDAQLKQTEANLRTAEANYQLAQIKVARWENLIKTKSVSRQETDDQISDAKAKKAIVDSMRANQERLRQLVNFERVIAPFAGTITSRTTDIGRLINAGSGQKLPLFRMVQSDRLRVYVRVPQRYLATIPADLTAQLHFMQYPNKTYHAKLLNTAQAVDVVTRSMLMQFEVDNKNQELSAGSYATVHFDLPGSKTNVRLPVNTLIFRAQNLQVATINQQHEVVLKSITIGRDFGDSVEVIAGLTPGEVIIINPSDSLMSGQKVRVVSVMTTTMDQNA